MTSRILSRGVSRIVHQQNAVHYLSARPRSRVSALYCGCVNSQHRQFGSRYPLLSDEKSKKPEDDKIKTADKEKEESKVKEKGKENAKDKEKVPEAENAKELHKDKGQNEVSKAESKESKDAKVTESKDAKPRERKRVMINPKNTDSKVSSGVKLGGPIMDRPPPNGRAATGPIDKKPTLGETVIPSSKKFISIVIPRRPLFPGLGGFCTFTEPEQIKILDQLDRDKEWDRSVVVFLGKNAETAKFLAPADDTYDIGVSCHVETIETSVGRDGKKTVYVALYPTCRVEKGTILDIKEPNTSKKEVVNQSDNGLDTASFDKIESAPSNSSPVLDNLPVHWMTKVTAISDEPFDVDKKTVQDLCSKIIDALHQLSNNSFVVRLHLDRFSKLFPHSGGTYANPAQLADFCAASCSGAAEVQQILETLNVEERLAKAYDLINRELASIELNDKMTKDLNAEMTQRHKKALLHEQQKIIARELGNDNGKEKLIATFRERMSKLDPPEEISTLVENEISKFEFQEHSGEATVSRSYLDWLTQLPWGMFSNDSYDIKAAKDILNADHFGLEDVKKRILEFIAVGKLKGSIDGKIICLYGPPGVGKTSIAKSIAESLGRKFERISLGGVYDASEIKGHRRTYVGALPGGIVQALKRCQTQNPVILLDEIDKTGRTGMHGDVSATLLEVLDPAQNKKFFDVYLEAPIDISKVLFICTANDISVIQRPLLDRMELIELSSYDRYEKATIAKEYLIKDGQKESGLDKMNVTFTSDAIDYIVRHYTADAGVRNLKQMIVKIFGKVALEVVDGTIVEGAPIVITTGKVRYYLGPPVRVSDKIYEKCDPGVVLGLAANSLGGTALFVESVLERPLSAESRPKFTRTGLLGETISESSSIAYTFSKTFMTKNYSENRFFDHAVIHTHLPEGGIKKDGPSAGITMTTSLLSLALNKAIKPDIAMTGEITLAGKVLPVGAIRSKVVAARSAGCKTVIFPKDNLADWEDLPDYLKEGITPVPAEWYSEVFKVAFGDVDTSDGNNVWKEQFSKTEKKHQEKEESNE